MVSPGIQVEKRERILAVETSLPHQAIAWMPIRLPSGSATIAMKSSGGRVSRTVGEAIPSLF
jgi:hypothetical protein